MKRLLNGFLIFVMLALGTMLTLNDGMASEKANDGEYGTTASPEATPLEPGLTHSNLLSTLEVAGDSCYVFLQPEQHSYYFGPIVKGEKVKWLDTQGDWVQVWIERLRVAGWLQKKKVRETPEAPSGPVNVPEDLLSTVTVVTKSANIRQAPSTRSRIITVAQKDQEFWLLNKEGAWCQIWLFDLKKKGWIYGKLITKRNKKTASE